MGVSCGGNKWDTRTRTDPIESPKSSNGTELGITKINGVRNVCHYKPLVVMADLYFLQTEERVSLDGRTFTSHR